MRKTATLFIFLFFIICAGNTLACPVEGPNMPNNKFWKTGTQINTMFDADMKRPEAIVL